MAPGLPDLSQYPTGITILRIFQAVHSIITIVVTSFTINAIVMPGNCLLIATSSVAVLFSLWMAFAHLSFSRLYNFWAAFILDTSLTVFWIISMAVLGSQTAVLWIHGQDYCKENKCPDNLTSISTFYGYVFATCFGLAAIGFLFSCAALIFHGVVSCRQHRYNKIGVNRDSVPIDIASKHPPESTAYNV
ncbi:Ff.00g016290.m01.CDS01 [Fusarium sp. VM40]|nr:Ff.00g016290.m01.CDS01 [Fusarium sp. VM40]